MYQKFRLQMVKESEDVYDYGLPMNNPDRMYDVFKKHNLDLESEEVLVLVALDVKNNIIGYFEVSRGELSSSIVHPREIFKRLYVCNASSFAIAHNHPSGDCNPSEEDIKITKRLKECSNLLGINLLDHIIVCRDGFYSIRANVEHIWN